MRRKINKDITIFSRILKNRKSIIYLAKNRTGERLIVKELNSKHTINSELREKFRNEAHFLQEIEHPHIPHLYHFIETETKTYIVMEFLEGVNIYDYVAKKRGTFNMPLLREMTIQLLDIVQYLHEHAILHLDIKPSNLILSPDNKLKLFDFEASKYYTNKVVKTKYPEVSLATFNFASPEQVLFPENIDQRSDIYSIGLTIYFLATGVVPFGEKKTINPLDKITEGSLDYSLIDNLALRKIVEKATNNNKEERYHNCMEFKDAIGSSNVQPFFIS